MTALDPIPSRPPRIVAGNRIDALPEQFSNQQSAAHFFEQSVQIVVAVADDQVVIAPRVRGRLQSELAGGIAAQKIDLNDTVEDNVPRLRSNALDVTARRCTPLGTCGSSRIVIAGGFPAPRLSSRKMICGRTAPLTVDEVPTRPVNGRFVKTEHSMVASLRARVAPCNPPCADIARRFEVGGRARTCPILALHRAVFFAVTKYIAWRELG